MPATARADSRPPNPTIIADLRRRLGPWLVAVLAAASGLGAAWRYAALGLTLSHYDAKAHLVVARRVVDSLTPGWVQIGAVWLPLPHLINLLPVQLDYFYRTGAFGVGVSVAAFAVAAYVLGRLLFEQTQSRVATAAGLLTFGLNPNVLYLQSTPMTEPLLMALTLSAAWLGCLALRSASAPDLRLAGLAFVGAVLTRYEAWPMTAAFLALAVPAAWIQHGSPRRAFALTARLAVYPALAVAGFFVLSRATVGEWFVRSGFFVAENPDLHRPFKALASVWWGVHQLSSVPLAIVGAAGLLMLTGRALRMRGAVRWLPLLSLVAVAALPWYAFYSGHPFRIRYMVPLLPVLALGVGCAVGLSGRLKVMAAVAAFTAIAAGPRPFDPDAPMVREAQWDRSNQAGRARVAAYLRTHWDGEPIMASMGSLAHFMQELSRDGFHIRDFLHEGNGDIWLAALEYPAPHVEWMLIEEQAEGGDMLAVRARTRPGFLDRFTRVAAGGGVALYRRQP